MLAILCAASGPNPVSTASAEMKRGGQGPQEIEAQKAKISWQDLPDAIFSHIAPFLSAKALARFSLFSKSSLSSVVWSLVPCRLDVPQRCKEGETLTITQEDILGLKRWLSRGQGCTSIEAVSEKVMEPLATAIRQQPQLGQQLLELDIYSDHETKWGATRCIPSLTQLLQDGALPRLRQLKLDMNEMIETIEHGDENAASFFKCLGEGACAELESLTLGSMDSAWLPLLADAMASRGDRARHLRNFEVDEILGDWDGDWPVLPEDIKEPLTSLLQASCLSQLERLSLYHFWGPWAAGFYLNLPAGMNLVRLDCGIDSALEDAEALVLALAAGKAPLLRKLWCSGCVFAEPALSKLRHAVIKKQVFQHVEELTLRYCFEHETQAVEFMIAVAAACPLLTSFEASPPKSSARGADARVLTAVLRASESVRLLRQGLQISDDVSDLRGLIEAVTQHRHGLPSLTCLHFGFGISNPPAPLSDLNQQKDLISMLATFLERCPSIQHLGLYDRIDRQLWAPALIPGGAAAHGTQGLSELKVTGCDVTAMEAMLQGLVEGACPKLRSLSVYQRGGEWDRGESMAGSPEGQEALIAILGGQAPCSATLHTVQLDAYLLSEHHVRRLSEVINDSTVPRRLRLEYLHFEGGLGVCMELLHALSKVHAGGQFNFDELRFISLSASECEVLKAEVAQLVQAGALPS